MSEHKGAVTFQGVPLTLVGNTVKIGDLAPDVSLTGTDMNEVKLSSFRGKVCVILSVPSLDTAVCDIETRRFNLEAEKLGSNVHIIAVSMDLPFAQKRWCGAASVERVHLMSDHKEALFGNEYGLLIKELRLLARSVIILDREGYVRYNELVGEITKEPNYEEVLAALKELL
ncbi:MAG TPA: thiol peroxidase [bacterium]|jgi:thiol peroxidase|nr:thiol peroxidase [Myxococcales bacterium]OQA62281.1 MAG: putative thiol peroxidase [bacterium ADurb.Bin270]HPW45125.1 thiol peroxidase [bacterium]HQG13591.1 thiol peroxidase [bacterium]HQH80709.1 thiol peroxidase [bacterium]